MHYLAENIQKTTTERCGFCIYKILIDIFTKVHPKKIHQKDVVSSVLGIMHRAVQASFFGRSIRLTSSVTRPLHRTL